MTLVVGLGNFGAEYENTLHNCGFMVAECLAKRLNLKFGKRECESLVAVGQYNGEKIVIAKPLTYMNLSGVAVKQLLSKYGAAASDLVVCFDDIDLPRFSVRVRLEGSGGTHNGMRNIIEQIGTKAFRRVRVGVGSQPDRMPLADYVLSRVPKADAENFAVTIEQATDEVLKFIGEQKK